VIPEAGSITVAIPFINLNGALGGSPPNLDAVLQFASNQTVAIESKFTEWMGPKSGNKAHFRPAYFLGSKRPWGEIGLPNCQSLAERIKTGAERFRHLDAPQLLKHALGLATGLPDRFSLYYLYYDVPGSESALHRTEVKRFADQVGEEIGFCSITYQNLFERLAQLAAGHADYLGYLQARYF
jgi:hypothetical protein